MRISDWSSDVCSSDLPDLRAALEMAAERIRAYHAGQKPEDRDETDAAGVRMGARWTAVESAGLYVPGGLASYPSSVLMNAIPARVAGVDRLKMVKPPRSEAHTAALQSLLGSSYAVFCLN